MELKVMSLDGEDAGSVDLRMRSSASSRERTSCTAACAGNSPSASAAPTTSRTAPRSTAPARRCIGRRAPARPVTAPPGSICSAAAADRSVLPRAATRSACRRRYARSRSGTRLSAKAKDGGIIVLDKASVKDGKTKALQQSLARLGLTSALIIDGARSRPVSPWPPATFPNIDVLPVQGINVYDILRRQMLVLDQVGARSIGGALQMTTTDPRHYDVIISPVITEKATHRLRAQPGDVQGRDACDQAADQGGGGEALRRQGQERQHPCPQRQGQGIQGNAWASRSQVKRAIVTLEEGHRIDVTTGL